VDHLKPSGEGGCSGPSPLRCPVMPDARHIHGPGITSAPGQPVNMTGWYQRG